jgi:hypothetical protein
MQKNKEFGKPENLESLAFIDLKFSKFPMLNIPITYGQTLIPLTVVPPSFTAHRSLYREIPYYRIF